MSELVASAIEASGVRVTVEVAGLTETWDLPATESNIASALHAVETVAAELRERYRMAQELERTLGDGTL